VRSIYCHEKAHGMLIREVILENFMSYEYARVPFKPGVNIVCGPNGAGKSSILLGISIALGQSYTERSRKLSNLIRWENDQARVTIVLDNSPRNGKRPVARTDKDQIFLTRALRRDGKYWFELDNRAATKNEVERMLARFSVDPDNLLIIMHQNMTEQFTVLSSQDKLRTVEAAVGLEPYRRNVLQARKKLSRILSEEESVSKLLESAEQTLNYWREQYDRYQQKKQLQIKRRFLERELVWAEAFKKEALMNELQSQLKTEENEFKQIEDKTTKLQATLSSLQPTLEQSKSQWHSLFEDRLLMEREKAENQAFLTLKTQSIEEMRQIVEIHSERINECVAKVEQLETAVDTKRNPDDLVVRLTEIKRSYKDLEDALAQQINQKSENLKTQIEASSQELEESGRNLSEIQDKTEHMTREIEDLTNQIVDSKINIALLNYQKQNIEKSLQKLRRDLKTKTGEYEEAEKKAEQTGSRIASTRATGDITDEIRLTDGYLAALADVSEDIEHMYESYSKLYLDLKDKARTVEENREKTLEEVKTRMDSWRTVMQSLLDHVNLQYRKILSQAQAVGEVHMTNGHDIEAAGLDVLVGFKGAVPVPLDAYTQSGGERSMATMSFLLALQQHVQSPFRAVDEYDVHMDPRNRETITNLLIDSVKGLESQYLIITPSQITFAERDIHVVTVQNVEGASRAKIKE
jgi:chromosome segregation ATPase